MCNRVIFLITLIFETAFLFHITTFFILSMTHLGYDHLYNCFKSSKLSFITLSLKDGAYQLRNDFLSANCLRFEKSSLEHYVK